MLLSDQKGMIVPEVWSIVVILTLLNPPVSQMATCRSLILLKPVVAMLSRSPIQTTRAPYARQDNMKRYPMNVTYLDTTVTLSYTDSFSAGPRVEQSDLAISARCHKEVAARVKRQALNRVAVPTKHCARAFRLLDVPHLDDVVASSACKDVVGSGMEEYVTDATR